MAIERVFRICKYTKFSESRWKLKKKFLYDSEKDYKLGIRKNMLACDRQGSDGPLYMRFAGEEFVNGTWIEILRYPAEEDFDEEEQRALALEKKKEAKRKKTKSWAKIQKETDDAWQRVLEKRRGPKS